MTQKNNTAKKLESNENQLYIPQIEVVDLEKFSSNELVELGIIPNEKAEKLENIIGQRLHKINDHNDLLSRVIAIRDVIMKDLPYHNTNHAQSVYEEIKYLAKNLNIDTNYQNDLEIAAQGHDFIVEKDIKYCWAGPIASYEEDNELKSAYLLMYALYKMGAENIIGKERITNIGDYIKSTKVDREPTNLNEKIIRDADMNNLYKDSCLDCSEKILEKELYIYPKSKVYELTIKLLENHKYHTTFKGDNRAEGLKINLELAKQKLQELV